MRIDLICIMTSQGLMPARNAGLSSHRPGKLNNSKWPLSKFSWATTILPWFQRFIFIIFIAKGNIIIIINNLYSAY